MECALTSFVAEAHLVCYGLGVLLSVFKGRKKATTGWRTRPIKSHTRSASNNSRTSGGNERACQTDSCLRKQEFGLTRPIEDEEKLQLLSAQALR